MTYSIWTDGACRGNGKADAVGGWGFFVLDDDSQEVIHKTFGGEIGTTNNRMELQAMLEAVKYVTERLYFKQSTPKVTFYTDSTYVQQGLTDWVQGWLKRNWKNVKNDDLWKELIKEIGEHDFTFKWVKAHCDDVCNDLADSLANKGCDLQIEKRTAASTPDIDTKQARFCTSMSMIYGMKKDESSVLFKKYLSQDAHDYHSVSNRVFQEIMEN